ncbi:MAG: hypothetical protein GXO78_04675 [Calditrichaeota bacterium]|nr:hypothetical protein [Calditrichota bacterium]
MFQGFFTILQIFFGFIRVIRSLIHYFIFPEQRGFVLFPGRFKADAFSFVDGKSAQDARVSGSIFCHSPSPHSGCKRLQTPDAAPPPFTPVTAITPD